jgi:nucleotide-binding universal stress UspA family protein
MRVLIPMPGDEREAAKALAQAVRHLGPHDQVHLLHVVPADPESGIRALTVDRAALAARRARLRALAERCGLCPAEVRVLHGMDSVAAEVVEYAAAHDIPRIIVATHGRRGLSRWVMGSVAEEIDRLAKADVVIVPLGGPLATPAAKAGLAGLDRTGV